MPVKLVKRNNTSIVRDVTRGRARSSFQVVIPAKIVKVAGFGKEETFMITYDPKTDIIKLKRVSFEELEEW